MLTLSLPLPHVAQALLHRARDGIGSQVEPLKRLVLHDRHCQRGTTWDKDQTPVQRGIGDRPGRAQRGNSNLLSTPFLSPLLATYSPLLASLRYSLLTLHSLPISTTRYLLSTPCLSPLLATYSVFLSWTYPYLLGCTGRSMRAVRQFNASKECCARSAVGRS